MTNLIRDLMRSWFHKQSIKTIGILNKIKCSSPQNVRLMIYNTSSPSYFNHGIVVWV